MIVELPGDVDGQLEERLGQTAIDRAGPRSSWLASDLEEKAPIDHAVGGHGTKADQVGEKRQVVAAALDAVGVPHLRVTVPKCGVGKLERDRDSSGGSEEARSIVEQSLRALRADRRGQEVVEHCPLVVPGQRPTSLGDQIGFRDAVLTESINEAVMSLEHGDVHLRDQKVHVLARVADQRDALLVPRQVLRAPLVVESEQHLGRVFPAKEERVANRAVAIHGLEVQACAAGVPNQRRVVVMGHRGSVGCDVMGDELPEHRPACRHS